MGPNYELTAFDDLRFHTGHINEPRHPNSRDRQCGSAALCMAGIDKHAHSVDSPIAFTAKILQVLVKNNILKSTKGVGGGFMILKNDLKNLYVEFENLESELNEN